MTDYATILTVFYPGSEWILNGDEYAGLEWLSDTPKPTKKTLDDLAPKLAEKIQAEIVAKAAAKQAILDRLGITAEEAKIILS